MERLKGDAGAVYGKIGQIPVVRLQDMQVPRPEARPRERNVPEAPRHPRQRTEQGNIRRLYLPHAKVHFHKQHKVNKGISRRCKHLHDNGGRRWHTDGKEQAQRNGEPITVLRQGDIDEMPRNEQEKTGVGTGCQRTDDMQLRKKGNGQIKNNN